MRLCDSTGRTTPVDTVWGMIRKMKGNGKEYGYPVLTDERNIITSTIDKAELIAKTVVKVHSIENLSQQETRERAETVGNYQLDFENKDGEGEVLNIIFTKAELNNALTKFGKSSQGNMSIQHGI